MTLRVAFDGQSLHGHQSGLGVYTTSLVGAMRQVLPADIDVDFYPDDGSPFCRGLNTPRRLQWETLAFPALVKKKKYDLVHIPAFACGWHSAKIVLTVHDLIGMAFPNQAGAAGRFYWGHWLPWAARRADHIIADSEHTRRDLMRLLRIPDKKMTLVYPSGHETFKADIAAEDIQRTRLALKITKPYFIFVGTFEPRKNLVRVLEAFELFLKTGQDYQLVLVGARDFAHGKYSEQLRREKAWMADRVITPGFVDHADLNALYCGAVGLVFPSMYEGFGIPILEAMAAGCPVITANVSSTPEVAGEAALLIDPLAAGDIARAMDRLAGSSVLRKELREKGLLQINKFSWKKTAQEIIQIYRKVG